MATARTKAEKRRAKRTQSEKPKRPDYGLDKPAQDNRPPAAQLRNRPHTVSGGKGAPRRYTFQDGPIIAALSRGKLTPRQAAAAVEFASLCSRASPMGGPRDSLDITPRGGSEAVTAAYIDACERWRDLTQKLGMIRTGVLLSVCVRNEDIGLCRPDIPRFRHLVEGLNVVADFSGLSEDGG